MDDRVLAQSEMDFDWSIAKQWIGNCQHHSLCRNEFLHDDQTVFLPRRLLEITPSSPTHDASNEKPAVAYPPSIRLLETGDNGWPDHEHSYVALSHFFDEIAEGPEITRLTKANLEKLKISIPFDSLATLFQNAVTITNQLGFSYLWIDALCVIDDSEEDQALELTQKGLVFSNATCTISISSPGARSGVCLTTKPPVHPARESENSTKLESIDSRRLKDTIDELFINCVDSQALNRWSWASFQERLLSRRILHVCCEGGVLFECNTMRASEQPKYREGVSYSSLATAKPSSDPSHQASWKSKPLVPGSTGTSKQGKTYTYHTRKKTIDRTSGAFKFETVVLTKDLCPEVQEQLEDLQSSHAWRRHRGTFHRLLRATKNPDNYASSQPSPSTRQGATTMQLEDRLALHNAWFALLGAYSCSSSLINKGSLDRNRKRLLGLNGIVDIIAETHRRDNFQLVLGPYVAGLWLETMPFNLLWFRANPVIVAAAKQADPEYFAQYPGAVLHYQAPPGSLDSRDRVASEFKIPTWSWASVDGQISHNLPPVLAKLDADNSSVAKSIKKLFTSSKSQASQVEVASWNMVCPLIDQQVEIYDHWTQITPDMATRGGATVLPGQLSQLRLRIRNWYPVFTIPTSSFNSKGIHVFYDSIDRLHQAVYPGHDVPTEPKGEKGTGGPSPITRAVFGLPILELSNWGNESQGAAKAKRERQLHGLALRHVKTVDGRGDVYERVGYFYTADEEVIERVMYGKQWGNVVWIQ